MVIQSLPWAAHKNLFYIGFINFTKAFEFSSTKKQPFSLIIALRITKNPKTEKAQVLWTLTVRKAPRRGRDAQLRAEEQPPPAQLLERWLGCSQSQLPTGQTVVSGVSVAPKHFLAMMWHETLSSLPSSHTQVRGCIWQRSRGSQSRTWPRHLPTVTREGRSISSISCTVLLTSPSGSGSGICARLLVSEKPHTLKHRYYII